ncbi:MAG: CotH kinase family protein [Chitinophagaceae bacterium]|nr:CotH kinase family protein [Chitinophagaceae bacterium]
MKKFITNTCILFASVLCFLKTNAQNLYDVNNITKIEITFTQPNWDYQMDTAKNGSEEYLMATQVLVNGISFDSVGVKYKGNSSFDSTKVKNPIHISFDEFKNQTFQGYKDIKLSNGYGDPSMIREVLAYHILGNYMECPKSNFAQLYINGNYVGIFSSSENIDKKFCGDHFYSSSNTFVKCNPIVNPGPTNKSNFRFIDTDSNSYMINYEMKSKYGWNELAAICDTIVNNNSTIETSLDMDRIIWMLAFNNLFINLDSYNGVFAQNHYTYKDNNNRFNPIMWDLNMCFGAFPFAGVGATSMGNLTIPNMQQYATDAHAADIYWPLINIIQNNASYKKKYIAHMKAMANEWILNGNYESEATFFQSIIDTAIQSDVNKKFSYTHFQRGLDSNFIFGSYTIPGIKNLMDARNTFLQSTPEFMALAPTISLVMPGTPNYNSPLSVQATVANANNVFLGYRFDKTKKFEKIQMFDDGTHNDGAANDNVYGINFNFSGVEMQYYVYAENTDAASFLPTNAEYRYYTLKHSGVKPTLIGNQLVINELMADNNNGLKDEYNDREDWIELYNKSNVVLNLDDVYLSNTLSNKLKWKIPTGTLLAPNDYLAIWADDDSLEQQYHSNFNLSKDSGILILSNAFGSVLDSISFPTQTSDITFGRYPNGTGNFIAMNPTYKNANNNYPLEVKIQPKNINWKLYPNPAENEFIIETEKKQPLIIYDILGKKQLTTIVDKKININTSQWQQGIYFVKCGNEVKKLVVQKN